MGAQQAMFETLERRLVLHAAHAVLAADGTLEIEGDGQKDVIDVTRMSSRLIVQFRYYGPQSFDYKSVRKIMVLALGGNDLIKFTGEVRQPTRIDAGDGDDHVRGGGGEDTIVGGRGRDTLVGQGGNDLLRGRDDKDVLKGGDGNDRLYGGDGNDALRGNAGRDALYGEDGNDSLDARDGEVDLLDGGAGKDRGEWDKKDSRKRVP
jgi:Ca2+-binding RTX toxin-like protein